MTGRRSPARDLPPPLHPSRGPGPDLPGLPGARRASPARETGPPGPGGSVTGSWRDWEEA